MSSSQETKSISIMIAGRTYPLKVKVQDESSLRTVVEEINEKIKQFQLNYANRDKQDCMAMALLTYAVEFRQSTHNAEQEYISQKLAKLDALLEDSLS